MREQNDHIPPDHEVLSDEELETISGGYDWPQGMSRNERQLIRDRMRAGQQVIWNETEFGGYPTLK
ncbi:bacteriocin [Stappia sp. P2PMeth1]|uniref:bacteriocin n=1 Tax=Stappia sp. P2PMeth1 TaxID=2003586 RepID=UPI0016486924|nr:bacteriocin [Stappia sp. P2PMeth1]